jgi:hypothetical protein
MNIKNSKVLRNIIKKIKQSNEEDGVMSNDYSNERLLLILQDDDLIDDEDMLIDNFGLDGFHEIKDAENGMY